MAEAKKFGLVSHPIPAHKDGSGKECKCLINKDHHKNSKNEECTCRIGFSHNQAVSSHKDADGIRCNGPAVFDSPVFAGASADAARRSIASQLGATRRCRWCQREERYFDNTLVVVFRKEVSALAVAKFLNDFKPKGVVITSSKKQGLIEKNGVVAVTLIVAEEKNAKTGLSSYVIDELIKIFEEEHKDIVWAASRVMEVSFTVSRDLPAKIGRPSEDKEKRPEGDEEFPDEMSGV